MITPQVHVSRLVVPVGPRDHIQGTPTAPITLVEYGDFQCPYCARAHLVLQAVRLRLGNQLRLVFRDFPLRTIHPYAEIAAEAAEAAGAQGKFWEMHDMLFENQHALELTDLLGYAAELGLNVDRVATEITARTHLPRIRADFTGGVRSGVNGTPGWFINNVRYDGPWDQVNLTRALLRSLQPQQPVSR